MVGATRTSVPSFRILGALEGWYGDVPLRLGGALRERTLVMLLLEANRVVPVARLVEAAWDNAPPSSAFHQIRKAVAELRQRIPDGASFIVTDGPGYRAVLTEKQLDLTQYRAGVARARQAVAAGDRPAAVEALQSALELWRGPVMAGFGGPVIDAASAALEEQRLSAAEQLIDLQLEAGQAGAVIGELRTLVNQHPLRETLRGHLMLALYRTGRQAEALEEYNRVRALLADELGIDPSVELAVLYERILRHSPELAPPGEPAPDAVAAPPAGPEPNPDGEAPTAPVQPPSSAPEPAAVPVPRNPAPAAAVPSALPYDLRDFSGRESELHWITDAVGRASGECARIIAIDGMGGSGKTALAIRAAHRLVEDYPDGQLFVDLRGYTPGQEPLSAAVAQEALLAASGVPSEEMPTTVAGRTALWRSITKQRRLLVVLDNAADAEHVRPLVPASPECLTLVTSRPRLVDLDGADWLSLGTLSEEDGLDLLRRTLGDERVAREPEAGAELIRLCGRLPLALRIAAARLRNRSHWTIQRLADRLSDETRRLSELNSAGRSVAAALRMSYQAMNDGQRGDFLLLGLHPGKSIGVEEAGALLGRDGVEAENALEALLDAHLLEEPEPGAYSFHDLVRSFALGLRGAATAAQEQEAVRRLLDHYVLASEGACDMLFPERSRHTDLIPVAGPSPAEFTCRSRALDWLDGHRDNLIAAVELAYRQGHLRHAAYLPRTLSFHSSIRNHTRDSRRACVLAVDAARRLKDGELLLLMLATLAMEHWRAGAFEEGITCLEEALGLARSLGDRESEAGCMGRLGQMYNSLGDFHQALGFLEGASLLEQELGALRELAGTLNVLSSVTVRLGKFEEAADAAERAIAIWQNIGDLGHTIVARSSLGFALIGLRRPDRALEELGEALRLCEEWHGPSATALILAQHAGAHIMLGRPLEARRYIERALDIPAKKDVAVRQAAVESMAGRVFLALGEAEESMIRSRRAYDLAATINFRFEMAQALDSLAEASRSLGDRAAAEDFLRQADGLFQRMGVPENARRIF